MNNRFEMVAKTFQGLETVLAKELEALGAEDIEIGRRMVAFTGGKELMYRANFCCRTALRILKPIYKFKATDAEALYDVVKGFDWERVFTSEQTFSIDSTVYSDEFRHSKFVTYKVKDAIVDYFNEKYGKRPSVRISNADIMLNIHIAGDQVTISQDSSGEPLHKRGYRVAQTEAPINEVLAAGLIMMTGWKGDSNLIDPMCGSGTFLIEAALIGANINPGVFRSSFAFERWSDFDRELFDSIYNDESAESDFQFKIYGSDISPKAIDIATKNIKQAGVSKYIDLSIRPIQSYEEAPENAMLITNPPYGERISVEDMEALYESIGDRFKKIFRGYNAWVIGYKNELFDKIGLKPSVKYPILNGALECELRQYVIFDGKYNDFRRDGGSVKNDKFTRDGNKVVMKNDYDKARPFRASSDAPRGGGRDKFRSSDSRKPRNPLEERYQKSEPRRFREDGERGERKFEPREERGFERKFDRGSDRGERKFEPREPREGGERRVRE
ncbi:MAG: THUMP domain-containing protein, partial [Bacteroidales bacterium]